VPPQWPQDPESVGEGLGDARQDIVLNGMDMDEPSLHALRRLPPDQ